MSKAVHLDGYTESESCYDTDDEVKYSEHPLIPAYMNAVTRRQFLHEMLKGLPPKVQNRIVVLKNIQLEHLKIEAEFFAEVYKLEKQYHEKYQPLFDKRKKIVTGEIEPPNEEPKWKESLETDLKEQDQEFPQIMKYIKQVPVNAHGIPCFWLTIFRNTEILSEMVQNHDEPVLKKLIDIKIKYNDQQSYTLEFHFEKNDYFSDSVLTKQYFLKTHIDEEYPFTFEGPEVYKCKGCFINWEKKMNLTVKTIRKKQKHKERGEVRTIVKHVPNDSFFNFFNPPEFPEDKSEIDEESQGILATDFEIGHFLRARVIPKAVLYFTGDVVDGDDEDGYEEDDVGEETESDNEKSGSVGNTVVKKSNPNECQNQ